MAGKGRASSEGTAAVGRESGSRGVGSEHQNGRGRVAELQRVRMLSAMVQEIAEHGAANVSVAHVVGRSGVSRRTFYEIFDDREDCFLAAFDNALRGVAEVVVPAYESPGPWRTKLRAALTAALECLEYDRDTARLLIVESLAAGPRALERRRSVLARIISVVEQGRAESKGIDPPPLTAEGVVGGVLSVLHARVVASPPCANGTSREQGAAAAGLIELVGPLMGMITLPYLGAGAARKEVERAIPKHAARRPLVRRDPLQDLEMRLTYRTVRVLSAIALKPGSSNRSIGEAAEIGDQGQVSKLLGRLQRLGLIENKGIGAASRGEPNAWHLTPKGNDVHDTIASVPG